MRHKFQQVLNKIHDFLNGHEEPDQTETNSLTATIEEAIQKQTAVHLILSEYFPLSSQTLVKLLLLVLLAVHYFNALKIKLTLLTKKGYRVVITQYPFLSF